MIDQGEKHFGMFPIFSQKINALFLRQSILCSNSDDFFYTFVFHTLLSSLFVAILSADSLYFFSLQMLAGSD